MLCNIGMADRLSRQDLQAIFDQEGNENGVIPYERMVQIL